MPEQVTPQAPAVDAAPPVEAPPGLPTDADLLSALEPTLTPDKAPEPPAAKEPEKAKEAPKDATTPKESAVMKSIRAREADLQREKQAFALRQQQAEAGIQAAIEAGIQKAIAERFKDPRVAIKTLTDLGLAPQQIAEALVKPDAPSAEELARQAREETLALKKRLETETAQAKAQKDKADYLALAKSMEAQLPHLFEEWGEDEIIFETQKFANELMAECKAKGRALPNVSNTKLLQVLNNRAKARADQRAARAKAKAPADTDTQKAVPQGTPKAATNGIGHQGVKTGAPATTTLGKSLGERQTIATDDPVLMSNDDILATVQKKLSEGLSIKAR